MPASREKLPPGMSYSGLIVLEHSRTRKDPSLLKRDRILPSNRHQGNRPFRNPWEVSTLMFTSADKEAKTWQDGTSTALQALNTQLAFAHRAACRFGSALSS